MGVYQKIFNKPGMSLQKICFIFATFYFLDCHHLWYFVFSLLLKLKAGIRLLIEIHKDTKKRTFLKRYF